MNSERNGKSIKASILAVLAGWNMFIGVANAAHEDLGPMLFTVGSTIQATNGVHWAYLLWQATETGILSDRTFAVYAKAGDSGAPGSYRRIALVRPVRDPYTIRLLLERSTQLGTDLTALPSQLNALFGPLLPDLTLPLEDKIAAVVKAAEIRVELLDNLLVMSRPQPALAMCLGFAFATPIAAGLTTFEVRESDSAGASIGEIIGRVTVDAGHPTVLPAPQNLAEVPETTPKGHLNVRLRWVSPPDLRRFSLLHYGFNVYRVNREYAVAAGFAATPPAGVTLHTLSVTQSAVRLVNATPVVVAEEEAEPLAPFFIDDNDRFAAGGQSLRNGDQFYYFVTALDILGRDGGASTGRLVTVCDRLPPSAPREVIVQNLYTYEAGVARQSLVISWAQNLSTSNDVTAFYYVYRWNTFTNIIPHGNDPYYFETRFGPFPHRPNTNRLSYVDASFTSNDWSRTVWYTVRAVDDGACGPNFSGNSAPAWGVPRDWTGPAAPSGAVFIVCSEPAVKWVGAQTYPSNQASWQAVCARSDSEVAWAEFRYAHGRYKPLQEATNELGRIQFAAGVNVVNTEALAMENEVTFYCRVGAADDRSSEYATGLLGYEQRQHRIGLFAGWTSNTLSVAGQNCDRHTAVLPGAGNIVPPSGVIWKGLGVASWKIYRSINRGTPELIAVGGFSNALWAVWSDIAGGVVAQSAYICYYAQVFDEHGNPSPVVLLGCFTHSGSQGLPRPLLSQPKSRVDGGQVRMRLRWFCPPYDIERFEVWLAAEPGGALEPVSSSLTSNQIPLNSQMTVTLVGGKTVTLPFGKYFTDRVGSMFGLPGNPQFALDINVETGKTYTVFIRAVGTGGTVSPDSNIEQFQWSWPEAPDQPQVPWPARAPPPVAGNFHKDMRAVFLSKNDYAGGVLEYDQVGVLIGRVNLAGWPDNSYDMLPGTNAAPTSFLFREQYGHGLLMPFVLYRYQVSNVELPQISGDVAQVSPLLERIASIPLSAPQPHWAVRDPFIRVLPTRPHDGMIYDIFAMDTQPVIRGASYRYLIVQFDERGELRRVIPTDVVTVPQEFVVSGSSRGGL
jgi:hypothetical protein